MDIPCAFKWKSALVLLATNAKIPKTTVRIGKFPRKFLHWASDKSYTKQRIVWIVQDKRENITPNVHNSSLRVILLKQNRTLLRMYTRPSMCIKLELKLPVQRNDLHFPPKQSIKPRKTFFFPDKTCAKKRKECAKLAIYIVQWQKTELRTK